MANSSIGIFAGAVRDPLAGFALGLTMAVFGLLAGGEPFLSRAMESIRLRPSAGVTATLEVGRANDDGYLEGLIKALDATR
jgi:hypothetical protein